MAWAHELRAVHKLCADIPALRPNIPELKSPDGRPSTVIVQALHTSVIGWLVQKPHSLSSALISSNDCSGIPFAPAFNAVSTLSTHSVQTRALNFIYYTSAYALPTCSVERMANILSTQHTGFALNERQWRNTWTA